MNCEKVTYLIEKGNLTHLSSWERIQIRLHEAICKHCRKYEKDSKVLGKLLHQLGHITEPKKVLSKVEKENIKEGLKGL